jgi:hypothetical protein
MFVRVIYSGYRGASVTTPKNLDMISFLQWQTTGEPHTSYQEVTPPLKAKEEGPPTKKELIPRTIHTINSSLYD